MNLKEGRGRIPPGSRQAFDALSRSTQLDAARGKLGAAIELLERKTLPALEQSHRTLATLSRRPITRQRQSEACETDPVLDPDERLAAVCWAVRRRFDRAERALAPLTSSALAEVEPKPAEVRRSLRACDRDAIDTKRLDEVIEQLGAALPAWGHAVSRVIDRLCRLAIIRRGLQEGGWDDASLRTLQSLVRDIDALRGSLEHTEALEDDLAAARSEIEAVEKHWASAGSLAAETRELLGRIEAADLPVRVLDEALHEVRRSLTATYETAATSLDRVRLLTRLPWVRRAPERVELSRAMAGLEASHAGCRRVKDRIRRFLAVRTLHGTAWTVEACRGCRAGRRLRRAGGHRRAAAAAGGPVSHPLFRRAARLRQDVAGEGDRAGARPAVRESPAGGRLGRGARARAAAELPRPRTGPDRPGPGRSGGQEPGGHPRRDRQGGPPDVERGQPGGGAARGARPGAEHGLRRPIRRTAGRPVRGVVDRDGERPRRRCRRRCATGWT